MAPSTRTFPQRLKVAHVLLLITVVFIFSLTILPSKPVLGFDQYSSRKWESTEEKRKMVLGSRPPGCVNKCMNCRPCRATLVIPSHQKRSFEISSHGEDDSYYLLSWKCRCGNKLFQP
ncbi:hypothetical protein L484_025781 [Morus notabilis]|uniref:Epidermal patterning factor-like protein n=2 Tax=Morus notabilis TaxID=981085 RepID=W9RSF4_9ROSA|nr:hypothetical protein L484_025781 [Morus notabilis]